MTRTLRSPKAIRLAVGAAALGVVASVTAVVAPPASATVKSIGIHPSATVGTHQYATTCSYTVAVTVDDNTKPVYFFEEGQGPTGFAEAMPSGNAARVTWTPSRTGITYIYAIQAGSTLQVKQVIGGVGNGINTGSACIAI